mmetsp:Transcript_28904/g.77871  ORF Transcript_28904/g.77871 Transcript_28904/m.77871 type:complete len:398 (+) Transcript_28904:109-1302(+)|eukprot:CAMPEP_0202375188 /NCGR_PEP_ID=MMETSP1127-20130417/5895_1 /ASSEMBLY_ACC=CAM_ASM_000462 /TAXON_ID=3047 /ORGANISM="Dunaliella tertiolecta, Strain CCMP1320" /LENGTH=397 /DNA_ID=CAMNT_0048972579 /DNA_START=19 /DNA_END=1212 /DNA_ORIENTATION=-
MDQARLQAVREKQMEKQNRWMRERQAEMERVRALEELTLQQSASEPPQHVLYPSNRAQSHANHTSHQPTLEQQQQQQPSFWVSQPLTAKHRAPNIHPQQPQHASTRPEQVIDLALERITERLRAELKLELQNERQPNHASQAAAVAAAQQLDGFLAQELEAQNTCPICYELMVPPDKAPVLLFPCGHTFCQACTSNHMDRHKKTTCPVCRKKIDSKAPNYSLQQLILNFVARRDKQSGRGVTQQSLQEEAMALNRGPDGAGLQGEGGLGMGSEEGATADLLRRQNERLNFRLKVLQNELLDVITEEQALQQRLASADAVQAHIDAQEQDVLRRLEALHAELALVREKKEEQALKVEGVREEASRLVEQRALLTATIEPLEAEIEKSQLLLAGVLEQH